MERRRGGVNGGEGGVKGRGSEEGVKDGEMEERERAPLTSCKLSTVHSCDHYERRKRRRRRRRIY